MEIGRLMSAKIRAATLDDLSSVTDLLMKDSEERRAYNSRLWALAPDARQQIENALRFALVAEKPLFELLPGTQPAAAPVWQSEK